MKTGVDIFFFEPGEKQEVRCKICNSQCTVQRNVYGSTSSAMAMANKKVLHDLFTCPNTGHNWHDKAVKLFAEIEITESKRLAELLKQDLADLLAENNV